MSSMRDEIRELSVVERQLTIMLAGLEASLPDGSILVHPGEPLPQQRARVTKNGTFTPKKCRDAQMRVRRTLVNAVGECAPLEGNLAIACVFYRSSKRTVDGDNLLKLVTDAAKGVLWKDDSQLTGWACRIELDRENPRTVIGVAPHTSTLTR